VKFSIANWHERPIDFWLSHNAFTTMASPPKWAKDHGRNDVAILLINQFLNYIDWDFLATIKQQDKLS